MKIEREPLTAAQKLLFINLALLLSCCGTAWFGFWGLVYDSVFHAKDWIFILMTNLLNIMGFLFCLVLTAYFLTVRTHPEMLRKPKFKLERGEKAVPLKRFPFTKRRQRKGTATQSKKPRRTKNKKGEADKNDDRLPL